METRRTSRIRPQLYPDSAEQAARCSPYGDEIAAIISNTKHLLNEEGSYVVANNPTPYTPAVMGATGSWAAFADTAPMFIWKNNSSPSNPILMNLDYFRLIIGGTAPSASLYCQWALKIDNGNHTPTSDGLAATPQNANLRMGAVPLGQFWYPGPTTQMVVPASSSGARLMGRGVFKPSIPIVRDTYELRFGGVDGVGTNAYGTATVASQTVCNAAPIVLGPQEFAYLYLVFGATPATNALSAEFETGWWER